jgi:hypothetical protein
VPRSSDTTRRHDEARSRPRSEDTQQLHNLGYHLAVPHGVHTWRVADGDFDPGALRASDLDLLRTFPVSQFFYGAKGVDFGMVRKVSDQEGVAR